MYVFQATNTEEEPMETLPSPVNVEVNRPIQVFDPPISHQWGQGFSLEGSNQGRKCVFEW